MSENLQPKYIDLRAQIMSLEPSLKNVEHLSLQTWPVFRPLKPSGHYMYRQFNIQQFYVQPTQCIYVFCVDLRTNSDYFYIQH